MNGDGKSDKPVVPGKDANKGATPQAGHARRSVWRKGA
jgi:hypothetical protein